jgi:hypothetical protein
MHEAGVALGDGHRDAGAHQRPLERGELDVLGRGEVCAGIAGQRVVRRRGLGAQLDGDARARAAAYLASWSAQRSVEGTAGLGSVMTAAGVQMLRRQVTRRVARGIPVAAPFLIGAAIVARSNRRATEKLAERVLADLRAPGPFGDPRGGRV